MAEPRLRIRQTDDGFHTSRDIPSEWMPQLRCLFDFLGNLKRVRPELRWDLRITEDVLDVALIMLIVDVEKTFSKPISGWKEEDLPDELIAMIVEVMKLRAYEMVPHCDTAWVHDLGKATALLSVYRSVFPIQQTITVAPYGPNNREVSASPYGYLRIGLADPEIERSTLMPIQCDAHENDPLKEVEDFVRVHLEEFFGGWDGDE